MSSPSGNGYVTIRTGLTVIGLLSAGAFWMVSAHGHTDLVRKDVLSIYREDIQEIKEDIKAIRTRLEGTHPRRNR